MAITVAQNADHKRLTGKTLSVQAELTSPLKTAIVDVTWGACDTYTCAGDTVDLSMGGRFTTIITAEVMHSNKGILFNYEPAAAGAAATGKFRAYESGTTAAELDELASADAAIGGTNLRIRVTGF
jgi:hypothetical protein